MKAFVKKLHVPLLELIEKMLTGMQDKILKKSLKQSTEEFQQPGPHLWEKAVKHLILVITLLNNNLKPTS